MRQKLVVVATVVGLLAVVGVLQLQQLKIKRLIAENADLRTQLAQVESLQARNDGLAEQLKAAISASHTNQNELLRLRGRGRDCGQLEQENAQLKSERQQLALQIRQPQAAVVSSGQGQVTAISEVMKTTADTPFRDATDLGPLELQTGIAVHFDLAEEQIAR